MALFGRNTWKTEESALRKQLAGCCLGVGEPHLAAPRPAPCYLLNRLLKREVLEIFLLLEFLHSLLATCSLLLGCQTPPSRTCGFATSLINGCGSFCLLLRVTAAI